MNRVDWIVLGAGIVFAAICGVAFLVLVNP